MDFGTIRAVADFANGAADAATLVMTPGGVFTANNGGNGAELSIIASGTPGSYTVDSAAPFTDLTFTLPASELAPASAPPGSPVFELTALSAEASTGVNAGTAISTGGTIQTDNLGGITFALGATLTTDDAVAGNTPTSDTYVDGAYTGTFTITIDY